MHPSSSSSSSSSWSFTGLLCFGFAVVCYALWIRLVRILQWRVFWKKVREFPVGKTGNSSWI